MHARQERPSLQRRENAEPPAGALDAQAYRVKQSALAGAETVQVDSVRHGVHKTTIDPRSSETRHVAREA